MTATDFDIVTGAFGYSGRYITQRLLAMGQRVKTLTGHPERPDPFGGQVSALPFNFDQPDQLARSLEGATTLYNTYWVRFSHGGTTFEQAIANTRTLFQAAKVAGVRRVVHVSITNPSIDSPLPYFKGKAMLEAALMESGLSYAILRPTVIFSLEDVLVNNIAWVLRRFPVFAMPGDGAYRMQPIFVEDMAGLAVKAGGESQNKVLDAVGPETYTFDGFVRLVADKIGRHPLIWHAPPGLALWLSRVVGLLVGDVVLTRDEVAGLMGNLLVSEKPPTGQTRLSAWLDQHADKLGRRYASELGRHYR